MRLLIFILFTNLKHLKINFWFVLKLSLLKNLTMKHFLQEHALPKKHLFYLPLILMILFIAGCSKNPESPSAKVTTVATGLQAPMGIETDCKGNIWIAEPALPTTMERLW